MAIDRIIGLYPTNVLVTIGRWFILRSCTEGLSIFFRHAGIGFSAIQKSILLGSLWSLVNSAILLVGLLVFGFEVFVILAVVIAATLTAYYGLLWLAPYSYIHRRPAAASFALLNVLLLVTQIATIISYLAGNQLSNSNCAVELIFSIVEFLQLAIMLYAFLLDSMFWQGMMFTVLDMWMVLSLTIARCSSILQFRASLSDCQPSTLSSPTPGLYTDERTNLNLPMLGMWDMNDRNTVKMVTESIAQLERKVVYIIPFSQLRVDTRYVYVCHL